MRRNKGIGNGSWGRKEALEKDVLTFVLTLIFRK